MAVPKIGQNSQVQVNHTNTTSETGSPTTTPPASHVTAKKVPTAQYIKKMMIDELKSAITDHQISTEKGPGKSSILKTIVLKKSAENTNGVAKEVLSNQSKPTGKKFNPTEPVPGKPLHFPPLQMGN